MRSFWLLLLLSCQVSRLSSAETEQPVYGMNGSTDESFFLILEQDPAQHPELRNRLYAAFVAQNIATASPNERMGIDLEAEEAQFQNSSLDDVRSALFETRSFMRTLELERATQSHRRTTLLFQKLDTPWLYEEIHIEILAIETELYVLTNNTKGALQAARLWARLKSGASLHPGLYTPNVRAIYDEARQLNQKSSQGYLLLGPRTSDASRSINLYLNHQRLEEATEQLSLPAGTHFLSIHQDGHLTVSQTVNIRINEVIRIQPFLNVIDAAKKRSHELDLLRREWVQFSDTEAAQQANTVASRLSHISELTGSETIVWMANGRVYVWTPARGVVFVQTYESSGTDINSSPMRIVLSVLDTLSKETTGASPVTIGGLAPSDEGSSMEPTNGWDSGYLWVLLSSIVVGGSLVVAGTTLTVGSLVAVSTTQSTSPPTSSPPRTVVVTCCGRGAR